MPNDRDGQHAGGSIVDTTRANKSSEQIQRKVEEENREREEEARDERRGNKS